MSTEQEHISARGPASRLGLLCCSQHPPGVWSFKFFWSHKIKLEGSVSAEQQRIIAMLVVHHSLALSSQAVQHVYAKQRLSNACNGSLTLECCVWYI